MCISKVNFVFLVINCHLVICSLCDLVLLVKCYLGNLVLFVIVQQPPPPLQSTLNVNIKFVSIKIKLKLNIVLELYFVSSRNACDPGPWNVPYACKCVCFTCRLKIISFWSKLYDLELLHHSPSKCCYKVDVPKRLSFHARPTMGENPWFYPI